MEIRWSPEKLQRSVQPDTAEVPVFRTVTVAVKPVPHELLTWYAIEHEAAGGTGSSSASVAVKVAAVTPVDGAGALPDPHEAS